MQLDTDHALLLRAVAKNTNDKLVQKAYSDFLQERNSAGYLIVDYYKIHEWPVIVDDEGVPTDRVFYNAVAYYKLPWIDGYVPFRHISHHLQRIKYILNVYADGKAVEL